MFEFSFVRFRCELQTWRFIHFLWCLCQKELLSVHFMDFAICFRTHFSFCTPFTLSFFLQRLYFLFPSSLHTFLMFITWSLSTCIPQFSRYSSDVYVFVPFLCLCIRKIFWVIMCLCWSALSMSWSKQKCYKFSFVHFFAHYFFFVILLFSFVSLEIQSPAAMQKVVVHAKQFHWSRAAHQLVTHIEVFMCIQVLLLLSILFFYLQKRRKKKPTERYETWWATFEWGMLKM